ncbi:C-X-C chemokine receptor type 3-like isoform X1 [Stegostoma tigrinum]|uniref:C-X-C chemokine receptor type 3-like isoform X1 n=1 Tax=Stegostoma tigrinum TaxID=3053191 RepID=UPI00287021BE|nr:C-X-C chemokine receptor type 3-like isoform X1 [Stegostoma tigrinum]
MQETRFLEVQVKCCFTWKNLNDFNFSSFFINTSYKELTNFSYDPCDSTTVCLSQPCNPRRGLTFSRVFIPTFYVAVFLAGLLGNGLVVVVLARNLKRLAATETYVLHLAVADLLLVVGLPFWAAEAASEWVFGNTFCKVLGALYNISFYGSIYLLGCISFDRYLSIVHAVQLYKKRRPWRVYLGCLAVWFFCILLAIPDLLFLQSMNANGTNKCAHNYGASGSKGWIVGLRFFYHVTGFLLPLGVMSYSYLNIGLTLMQSHNAQRQKERRTIKVIATVVIVFFLCWTPYNAMMFLETLHRLGAIGRDCNFEEHMDTGYSLTACLGNLHCCLNPFLYAFAGAKFRMRMYECLEAMGCAARRRWATVPTSRRQRHSIITISESGDTSYSGF